MLAPCPYMQPSLQIAVNIKDKMQTTIWARTDVSLLDLKETCPSILTIINGSIGELARLRASRLQSKITERTS